MIKNYSFAVTFYTFKSHSPSSDGSLLYLIDLISGFSAKLIMGN
jgi:hypothetical protein